MKYFEKPHLVKAEDGYYRATMNIVVTEGFTGAWRIFAPRSIVEISGFGSSCKIAITRMIRDACSCYGPSISSGSHNLLMTIQGRLNPS